MGLERLKLAEAVAPAEQTKEDSGKTVAPAEQTKGEPDETVGRAVPSSSGPVNAFGDSGSTFFAATAVKSAPQEPATSLAKATTADEPPQRIPLPKAQGKQPKRSSEQQPSATVTAAAAALAAGEARGNPALNSSSSLASASQMGRVKEEEDPGASALLNAARKSSPGQVLQAVPASLVVAAPASGSSRAPAMSAGSPSEASTRTPPKLQPPPWTPPSAVAPQPTSMGSRMLPGSQAEPLTQASSTTAGSAPRPKAQGLKVLPPVEPSPALANERSPAAPAATSMALALVTPARSLDEAGGFETVSGTGGDNEIVAVGLTLQGRRKVVKHLQKTLVGDIIKLHLSNNQVGKQFVVVDSQGCEIGKEMPLGLLARQACGPIELTLQVDEWADA